MRLRESIWEAPGTITKFRKQPAAEMVVHICPQYSKKEG
jgi:hypothetical protein